MHDAFKRSPCMACIIYDRCFSACMAQQLNLCLQGKYRWWAEEGASTSSSALCRRGACAAAFGLLKISFLLGPMPRLLKQLTMDPELVDHYAEAFAKEGGLKEVGFF